MKLTLPEGFTAPKTARPGEPFEMVATVRPSEDGTFALIALDGVKLPEDEEDDDEDEEEYVDEQIDGTNVRLPFGEEAPE